MPRSSHGGRHELGQNFLIHAPSIATILDLVRTTDGAITELGAGDGALTEPLAALRRPLTAIELDEHHAARLARRLPQVDVVRGDATRCALRTPVVVGNIPFHITTPLLRHLLRAPAWRHAILLTQWEVARKRAGVGGGTMMTAQAAPWFTFTLHSRVPRHAFHPMPSVDGGILALARRSQPLVSAADAHGYRAFVQAVFGGRGSHLRAIVGNAAGVPSPVSADALARASIDRRALARDLTPEQWAALWHALRTPPRGHVNRPPRP